MCLKNNGELKYVAYNDRLKHQFFRYNHFIEYRVWTNFSMVGICFVATNNGVKEPSLSAFRKKSINFARNIFCITGTGNRKSSNLGFCHTFSWLLNPPAGIIQWICGWSMSVWPHVCKTRIKPVCAPRQTLARHNFDTYR